MPPLKFIGCCPLIKVGAAGAGTLEEEHWKAWQSVAWAKQGSMPQAAEKVALLKAKWPSAAVVVDEIEVVIEVVAEAVVAASSSSVVVAAAVVVDSDGHTSCEEDAGCQACGTGMCHKAGAAPVVLTV
ncbi:uncharacterized protein MONOS_18484 [Monocercomonoides exilis]|uniref:uncharacterized protein n=1 Tax=Monocercomonoides exilis TaxID=2049356 RepID=UPI00355A19F2|nr:hypothetical protein MONOS_18484 [Monocercomonoides exilis]